RETRQLIWKRPVAGKHVVDSFVDLREVKEVRTGIHHKICERWQEECKKWESSQCFVILYGSSFKLKHISCAAMSPKECEQWVRGIRYLISDTLTAPYPLQVESWLRKEFYAMHDGNDVITLKDVKQFLPKINYKLSTNKLKECFQEVDKNKTGEIGFENFAEFYHNLMHENNLFNEFFQSYSSDRKIVTLQEFNLFLSEEQKDQLSEDERAVSKFMREYLTDPLRDTQEPYFNIREFMDFMFSKDNEVSDKKQCEEICQDMNRPLSHYWIASSHNTYLTGDQITSESSTDAYARCLRMGCRSVELDCWDGPEGMPWIYHGYTVTTKIKFVDTLKVIREHAFVVSDYPVILSIENHCSLPQQRNMAAAFQEILGDLLLTQPISSEETEMPSPNQLKRKFIIKHKKLPEGTEVAVTSKTTDESEPDISNSVKNGILYLEDPIDKIWKPHFFMLTRNKMYYAEESRSSEDDDENEERQTVAQRSRDLIACPGFSDELHFGEKWFHGKLTGGRNEAAQLLRQYSCLGDGTFLVRESETFVGDYSLSFWRQGTVNHCRIRSREEHGNKKYYLIDSVSFNSLYSLINHYQSHPLRSPEFSITLNEPVPQPNNHENKDWYHANMSRQTAEECLQRYRYDGAFLVRPSEQEENCFSISFRAENKIKHCRVKQEGRLFAIGTSEFESLVELINWYEKYSLYKDIKLKYPVTAEVVRKIGSDPNTEFFAPEGNYMDPTAFQSKVTVKALYDYRANREDELSFCKHAIITNVMKQDAGWWKGDYGGKKQHWFPANFVEEIETNEKEDESSVEATPLGKLQKGSIMISGCTVVVGSATNRNRDWIFRIVSPANANPIDISAGSEEEMQEWMKKIRETAQSANDKIRQSKEIERSFKIAKEFSDIIVYCRSVSFDANTCARVANHTEMSSFPENKIEKWLTPQKCKMFTVYHQQQLSRVYPAGRRIESSNYDPMRMWNCGVQMVSFNYQTGDRTMQLNQAKFMQNGGCGYVLKPSFLTSNRDEKTCFDVYNKESIPKHVEPIVLSINIIAARHLIKNGRGIVSPFVEIEVVGAEYDCAKCKTSTIHDNGFNPVWKETFIFEICCPELALLRFVVYNEDMFGDPNFIGQKTYPISCIRQGFRSVPLKNEFSEDLELASLLIHAQIKKSRCNEESYALIQDLKKQARYLNRAIEEAERDGNEQNLLAHKFALRTVEEQLAIKRDERL
ncbi:phospholipase C gamma-like protein, partial [Leptotrombidium deliense]